MGAQSERLLDHSQKFMRSLLTLEIASHFEQPYLSFPGELEPTLQLFEQGAAVAAIGRDRRHRHRLDQPITAFITLFVVNHEAQPDTLRQSAHTVHKQG